MTKHIPNLFKRSAIALAVSTSVLPAHTVWAQEDDNQIEKIEVTATRRTGTVQEIPINITALPSDVLQQQNIEDLADVARWVPGLTIQDQGGRSGSPIIVRGLNTNSSGPGQDGGTVATYYGDIPIDIDLRLLDVERVEVLIGPQGTLYGAGTLGGAIRYIPKKAELDITSGSVYGDIFDVSEASDLGGEAGFVFNMPLINDELAVRLNFNYFEDPGFIDYNYVVREGGVSRPDIDFSNQAERDENLRRIEDNNGEETTTARIALRWAPNDWFDASVNYLYQEQKQEGRSIVHFGSLSQDNPLSEVVGEYDSAYRYAEPRNLETSLLSLEMSIDLGFAELVSATGIADFEAVGQRDQTDLLIRLNYGYEEFPAFSSFTRELDDEETITQEIRLVSKGDSDLSWIVGYFYTSTEDDGDSREFTPGFDQFAVDNFGGVQTRPDALEYVSIGFDKVTEKALFGELSYQFTDALSMTVGARFFQYDVFSQSVVDLPLFQTVFNGRAQDSLEIAFDGAETADDSDNLFKFNVSYQATDEILTYLTVSEGFRIGGSNGVGACPANINEIPNQIVCALPNEILFAPDTTTNYELGFKSSWLKNKLYFNAALFNIDWDNAQVAGATLNGQQPITSNAASANSKGVELSTRAVLTDELTMYANYAYAKAELTEDAPFLFDVAFVDDLGNALPGQEFFDGKDGDRLPGSPENQFAFGLTYTTEVLNGQLLEVNYGMTYQSDIITKVGERDNGQTLSGYAVSNLSAQISDENWSVTFYVDNLFDKYAQTSVRRDFGDIGISNALAQNAIDHSIENRPDLQRNYGFYVLPTRRIGLRFDYRFEI